jgi:hypothetical protein
MSSALGRFSKFFEKRFRARPRLMAATTFTNVMSPHQCMCLWFMSAAVRRPIFPAKPAKPSAGSVRRATVPHRRNLSRTLAAQTTPGQMARFRHLPHRTKVPLQFQTLTG